VRNAPLLFLAALAALACPSSGQVVVSEIHYHPYEQPAFAADGSPVVDLSEDVHEFVEVHNAGAAQVDLSGWTLSDGVDFTFPPGTTIPASGYRVVAKDPTRLASVYGLSASAVLGPYTGRLSNNSDTVRLRDSGGATVDAVNYSANFPWSVSADALGAGKDLLGYDPMSAPYSAQYKGRSIQRVSVSGSSNDPANWVASPWPGAPSPGNLNPSSAAVIRPVVNSLSVVQNSDESATIRAGQAVRITCGFTSTQDLSQVEVQYWVDSVESFAEIRFSAIMSPLGNNQYSALLPAQSDRSIVRYRIRANRGAGLEAVSPRPDDPAITPVSSTTKEAWHGYFVTPVRSGSRPTYDFFISSANTSLLTTNISQNPRRTTAPDPPGYPRDEPFVLPPNPQWNGMVPAIFVSKNQVFDVSARFHGSRYRRSASLNSWKIHFPKTRLFDGMQRILITEKGDDGLLGFELFHRAGMLAAYSRFVDFYRNGDPVTRRLEITDSDEETFARYAEENQRANPDEPLELIGTIYKSKGQDSDEGPYGFAHGRPMATRNAGSLVPGGLWTPRRRYEWSFPLQTNDWVGHLQFEQMINQLWAARGDGASPGSNTNLTALRAYLNANWDVDAMLTYLAIRNWACPWDDIFHNHYVWRRANGKWLMAPWDFDSEFSGQSATTSIFVGMIGDPSNNFRGPNYWKDSILRAFSNEFRERMFLLNNTLLHPSSIQAIASDLGISVNSSWVNSRFASVNSQCNLGIFHRPNQPVNLSPANGDPALPPSVLSASPYTHTNPTPSAHTRTKWEIRTASGSFKEPVVATTTTENLTSFSIPFEKLAFGTTYFWRCTYYDAQNRPSLPSNETSFVFGQPPVTRSILAIDAATQWRYNQTANLDGVNWTAPAYDDSSWPAGAALHFLESAALPEAKRTPLTGGRNTYYFRGKFNFPGSPAGATLRLRQIIDDGFVLYINGAEVWRSGMPEGAISYATPASRTVGDAVYEPASGWFTIPASSLVAGENTIAAEVHQVTVESSDVVFGVALEADVASLLGDLVINEVLALNETGITNGGRHPDWIELFNASLSPIDLSGMSLSDDVLVPGKFVFPAGTSIPSLGHLVVWCDRDFAAPGLHTGFGLSRNGQTVALFSGNIVKDFVTFGPQIADHSIGRVGPAASFALNAPTPGTGNVAHPTLGDPALLRINEWMANPRNGEDWIEIFNPGVNPVAIGGLYLSDTVATPNLSAIPPLSFVPANGFTLFEADGTTGQNRANFKLSAGGDSIILTAVNGSTTIDSVSFGIQASGVSQGRLPDGVGTASTMFAETATPEASNYLPAAIVINEALTNSSLPLEDAVELHNPTGSAVDISGWWLSDSRSNLRKYRIPNGTVVGPGAYSVLYEYQFNPIPGQGESFSFSSIGEQVTLSAANAAGDLTGLRSVAKFGAAADGVSFGRIVNANGADFFPQIARTLGQDTPSTVAEFRTGTGAANAGPRIGPVIINEVAYHPPDGPGGADNTEGEFIELHNVTTNPIDLSGWVLKDAADFVFPTGTTIRPGEYMLVVGFDPADIAKLAAFRASYSIAANVSVVGPFSPKLSNSGSTIEIARTGPAVEGQIPEILVDRLRYADSSPWPVAADGSGMSLQRLNRATFGNDPGNWQASAPTPGRVNTGQAAIADSDGDGLPDTWEVANGTDPYDAADGLADDDGDGQSNGSEFIAGTDPQDSASVLRADVQSAAGGMKITFLAKAGKTYTVQYRNELGTGVWLKLGDIPAEVADRQVEITDPAPGSRRFYRTVTPAAQ
jgi:hypothetical protein